MNLRLAICAFVVSCFVAFGALWVLYDGDRNAVVHAIAVAFRL